MNQSMDHSRVAQYAYPVGLLLVLAPLLELAGRLWPIQWYLVQWRFQSELATVNSAPVLLLGALVIVAVAYTRESVGVLKLAGILLVTFGVLLLPLVALMVIDAFQVRDMARSEVRAAIRNNSILAVVRGGVAAIAAIGLGLGSLKAASTAEQPTSRKRAQVERNDDESAGPLLMMSDSER